jgi:hypothetical protein
MRLGVCSRSGGVPIGCSALASDRIAMGNGRRTLRTRRPKRRPIFSAPLGARIPDVPYQVNPGSRNPSPSSISVIGRSSPERCRRRTLKGIDQQIKIAKAGKAVTGQVAVKRNRFVQLTGGTKSVNREP